MQPSVSLSGRKGQAGLGRSKELLSSSPSALGLALIAAESMSKVNTRTNRQIMTEKKGGLPVGGRLIFRAWYPGPAFTGSVVTDESKRWARQKAARGLFMAGEIGHSWWWRQGMRWGDLEGAVSSWAGPVEGNGGGSLKQSREVMATSLKLSAKWSVIATSFQILGNVSAHFSFVWLIWLQLLRFQNFCATYG